MAPETGKPRIDLIPRAHIAPDPDQPRTDADDELKGSIANEGILEPIIVRPYPTDTALQKKAAEKTPWMIVNGERRWRGSAGVLEELPCIIRRDERVLDAARRKITQLAANEHKAMSPLDEGRTYQEIMLETGMSIDELADAIAKPRSTVGDRVRVMELGPWIPLIEAGKLPVSHAVEHLVPLRSVPAEYHERAIATIEKDWRASRDGGFAGMSNRQFGELVEATYRTFMYPLNEVKSPPRGFGQRKNPTFDTSDHDRECDCGGIKFDVDRGGKRVCCGNPRYWQSRHRKAMAAAKPKGKKSTERSSEPKGPKLPKVPNGLKIAKSGGYQVNANDFRKKGSRVLWEDGFRDAGWQLGAWYWSGGKQVVEPIFDVEDFCRSVDLDKCTLQVGNYSGVLLVSRDETAYANAVRTWKLRRAEEYGIRSGDFGTALRAGLDEERYAIAGAGVTILLACLGALPTAADDDDEHNDARKPRELSRAEQLLDVARALNVVTDDADDPNEVPPATWCDFTEQLEAGVVLAGLAVALDRGLTFPTAALAAWERDEIARMRKLPLTRLGKDLPDPASDVTPAAAEGTKWQRRKKRGAAKHATPAEPPPPKLTDDGAQEIRAAAEADDVEDLEEDLEEATADA